MLAIETMIGIAEIVPNVKVGRHMHAGIAIRQIAEMRARQSITAAARVMKRLMADFDKAWHSAPARDHDAGRGVGPVGAAFSRSRRRPLH